MIKFKPNYEWTLKIKGTHDRTTRSTAIAGMFKRFAEKRNGTVERKLVSWTAQVPQEINDLANEVLKRKYTKH